MPWAAIGVLVFLVAVHGRAKTPPGRSQKQVLSSATSASSIPTLLNTGEDVAYVGSRTCAECHQDIAREYGETDMARSMFSADDSSRMPPLTSPVTLHDREAHHDDEIFRRGDSIYQSEYALDAHGKEIYRHTEKLAYGVGAGENGYSFIIDRGGFLFQAPISYYSRTRQWDLSPGHELGFNRPILNGCIVCHTGRAQPIRGRDGVYKQPAFLELAIGCENCHGPGELHVRSRRQGLPVSSSGDPDIVNPARLPGWLANNICAFCHQTGDAVVLAPGREFQDFRPGTPLDRTLEIFNLPLKGKNLSPLLGHYSLMLLSRCYRAGGGRLTCITCHDPHVRVANADAPAYYRARCLQCHQESSCTVPITRRSAETPPDDCAGCHMPKQELKEIAHSALTDHRIIRSRGEPFPKDAFASEPGMEGLSLLDGEPGRAASVDPLTLTLAIAQISNTDSTYRNPLQELLPRVVPQAPNNPQLLGILARMTLQNQGAEAIPTAIEELERSVQLGTRSPEDYQLLAELLRSKGDIPGAVSILSRGIALDPYFSSYYSTLAACYRDEGDLPKAREVLESGQRLFPEDDLIREGLRKIEEKVQQ